MPNPIQPTADGRTTEVVKMLGDPEKGRFLSRDAYKKGMNVSRYLETLDPSGEHKNSRLDAFGRVLRACNIRSNAVPSMGIRASTLDEMINSPAQHLVIEMVSRAYRGVAQAVGSRAPISSLEGAAGSMINQFAYPSEPRGVLLEPAIPLAEMVGRTTGIDKNYYRPFYIEEVKDATSRVAEGTEVPAIKIGTAEKTVNLVKYGRRIDMTYESTRHIPIDLLSFYIRRIAVQVETDKVDKVLSIIVAGDGNAGTTPLSFNLTTLDPDTTAGNLTLRAWLAFKMKFKNPYMLTHVIGQDAAVLELMLLNAGNANIPLVALGGVMAAQSVTPINQGLRDGVRAGWLDSAPASKLVAFDRRLSVERVFEIGGSIQEAEKDVKQQLNSVVLTEVEGYNIMEPLANKILVLNA